MATSNGLQFTITVTINDTGKSAVAVPENVRVEVEDIGGMTARTTVKHVGNGTVRRHTRFVEHEPEEQQQPSERDQLAEDLTHWIAVRLADRGIYGVTALLRPRSSSKFAHRPSAIETHDLYHRHIYHHSGDDGYWINTDSQLFTTFVQNGGQFHISQWPKGRPLPFELQ